MEPGDINRLYAQDVWKAIIAAEASAASLDESLFIGKVTTEYVPGVVPHSGVNNKTDSILVRPSLELWKAAANGEVRDELKQVAILVRFRGNDMKPAAVALSFTGERLNASVLNEADLSQMRQVFPAPSEGKP